ncbi:MAG: bifunctional serine/threonine-protein kinase/formylglycine-generating enzyme family protein [Acidobacteriota bacterium]|mgnify:CR=1 FL=1
MNSNLMRIGPYSLVREIGRGMFGIVWLAEKQTQAGRFEFAVKLILKDSVHLEKLQHEISVWKTASGHANILTLIEADIQDGYFYIVSEHIADGSLQEKLTNSNRKGLALGKSIEITKGILSGLEHLHSLNIIHRDLKPANILMQGEIPRLTDFGVSKIAKNTTQSTNVSGTYSYLPPEAFDGKFSEKTDLWAVSIILYQLLTGNLPFPQKELSELIGAIMFKPAESLPSNFPPIFQQFLDKAFQKNPNNRFSSAREMKDALTLATQSLSFFVPPSVDITQYSQETQISPREQFSEIIVDFSGKTKLEEELVPTIQTSLSSFSHLLSKSNNVVPKSHYKEWSVIILILGAIISVPFLIWFFSSSLNRTSVQQDPAGMVLVDGGEFEVGRANGDDYEKPTYKAKIKSFFIDITEVTREAYKSCVESKKCENPDFWKDGIFPKGTGEFPMTGLSWDKAKSYCEVNEKRLPTEEEWEFAAKGKDKRLYPWGDSWSTEKANVGSEGKSLKPVKQYKDVSPFGLYDLAGNAWEWTESRLEAYPNGKLPVNLPKEDLRVIRGGSFESGKEQATTTYRRGWLARNSPEGYENTGFRCAKTAPFNNSLEDKK